jgi:hypothetical protein
MWGRIAGFARIPPGYSTTLRAKLVVFEARVFVSGFFDSGWRKGVRLCSE